MGECAFTDINAHIAVILNESEGTRQEEDV